MDSKTLVEKIIKDPQYFWEIIDEYEEKLLRYVQRISDIPYEDAENLVQDIFIKVYKNINSYDSSFPMSSWIYRIAHNETIDYFRKNTKHSSNISLSDEEYKNLVESITDWKTPHDDLKKWEIRNVVKKAISMLSPDYKDVIMLKFIEEKSYEEISDILKMPVWTVWTLINRAKKQLQVNLEKLHFNN
jgi:RNA polymerase sigma-70 factor, ECF subfamily